MENYYLFAYFVLYHNIYGLDNKSFEELKVQEIANKSMSQDKEHG